MTSRSAFLTATVVAAATPGRQIAQSASATYDIAALDATLAKPYRHRQVFAVPHIADGAAFAMMRNGLDAYAIALAEGTGTYHAAAVFYARAVVLGLSDAMWAKYGLADAARRRGEILTARTTRANPFARELAALAARGASFFVCDEALADWSRYLLTMGFVAATSDEAIHAELRAHVIPSALLVPAGVVALNAAQEARFTYVQGS